MSRDKRPPGIATAIRNTYYEQEIDRLKRSGGSGSSGPAAGPAIWFWSGTGTPVNGGGGWITLPITAGTQDSSGTFTVMPDGGVRVKDAGAYVIAASVYNSVANVFHTTIGPTPNSQNAYGEAYDSNAATTKILTPEALINLAANQTVYVTGNGPSTIVVREIAIWKLSGIKGDTGAGGATGPTGPTGATGLTGPPGPAVPGYDSAPVGSLLTWTGRSTVLPEGYVLANGAATYTRLNYQQGYDFAKAERDAGNTMWNYNAGAETFTVPDYRDRFILAAGARASGIFSQTNPALANYGADTHVLTAAQMPSHNHGGATGTGATGTGATSATNTGYMNANNVHNHGAIRGYDGTAFYTSDWQGIAAAAGWGGHPPRAEGGAYTDYIATDSRDLNHIHGIPALGIPSLSVPALSIASAGGDTAHGNMPPYVVLAILVKIAGVTLSAGTLVGPPGPTGATGPASTVPGPQGPAGVWPISHGKAEDEVAGAARFSGYGGGTPTVVLTWIAAASRTGTGTGGRASRTAGANNTGIGYAVLELAWIRSAAVVRWAADVKAPVGRTLTAFIDWVAPSTGGYASAQATTVSSGDWQRIYVDADVPADATQCNVYVWFSGGVAGEMLDMDRWWLGLPGEDPVSKPPVPAGGTTGQALVKKSTADYDTEWGAAVGTGGGGSTSIFSTIAGPVMAPPAGAWKTMPMTVANNVVEPVGDFTFNAADNSVTVNKTGWYDVSAVALCAAVFDQTMFVCIAFGPDVDSGYYAGSSRGSAAAGIYANAAVSAIKITAGQKLYVNVLCPTAPPANAVYLRMFSVSRVGAGPQGLKGDTGGNATVPMDSWHTVGAVGEPAFTNGTGTMRFRKDPFGRVWINGSSTAANGTSIFTLPVGYRPPTQFGPTHSLQDNDISGTWVYVNTDGTVVISKSQATAFIDLSFDTQTVTQMPTGPAGPKGDTGGSATVPMDPWHTIGAVGEPALVNGWAALASGFVAPAFRKDPLGKVQLRGSVIGGTNGATCFTLPAGYRPPAGYRFTGVGAQAVGWYQINVNADGTVIVWANATSGVTPSGYTSLDQIEFDTDLVTAMPTGPTGPAGPPGNSATVPMDTVHVVGAVGEPAFQGSPVWVNSGGGDLAAAFRKDPFGRVSLRGVVKNGTGVIFTLPVGYRPASYMRFAVIANSVLGYIYVDVNGQVLLGAGSNAFVDLAPVEFDTESVFNLPTGPAGPAGGGLAKLMDASFVGGTTLQFTNIPQGYTSLKVMIQGQSNRAGLADTGLRFRFNGIAAGYYTTYMRRDFTMAANAIQAGRTAADVWGYLGQTPAGSRTNDARVSQATMEVPFYAMSGTEKMWNAQNHFDNGSTSSGMDIISGFCTAVDPITRIDITDDVGGILGPMARATLYGIP